MPVEDDFLNQSEWIFLTKIVRFIRWNILFGEISINFDPKHLIKRLRGIFISDKKSIKLNEKSFNKQHVKLLLPNIKENILNPKDYQNVPAAVQLFLDMQKIGESNFIENKVSSDIKKGIKLFNLITVRLLNIFTNLNISSIAPDIDAQEIIRIQNFKKFFFSNTLYSNYIFLHFLNKTFG